VVSVGVKEDLINWAFSDGVVDLQNAVDIAALQKKYNAIAERVLMIDILDINTDPVYIQVKDGRVLKMKYHPNPDVSVTFKYLDRFLDVLMIDDALERLFAYDGRVLRSDRLVKEVWIEGDWFSGSIVLQKVFEEYIHVVRDILNSSRFFKIIVRPVAKIKRAIR